MLFARSFSLGYQVKWLTDHYGPLSSNAALDDHCSMSFKGITKVPSLCHPGFGGTMLTGIRRDHYGPVVMLSLFLSQHCGPSFVRIAKVQTHCHTGFRWLPSFTSAGTEITYVRMAALGHSDRLDGRHNLPLGLAWHVNPSW